MIIKHTKKLCHELTDSFNTFSESWNHLETDPYVEEHYRKRRYAAYEYNKKAQTFHRRPYEPHYQHTVYNKVYGGINRHFSEILNHPDSHRILSFIVEKTCLNITEHCNTWLIKAHQFRITAPGNPTPEGVHRDGVDYVSITLINRHNIQGGINRIYHQNSSISNILLENPGDTLLLNDRCVRHSTSPIEASLKAQEAYRDVLVLSYQMM